MPANPLTPSSGPSGSRSSRDAEQAPRDFQSALSQQEAHLQTRNGLGGERHPGAHSDFMAPPKEAVWEVLLNRFLPRLSFVSSENRILLLVIVTLSIALLAVAFVISGRYQASLDDNYERFGELIATVVSVGGADRMTSPLSPELKVKAFAEEMLSVSGDVGAIEFYDTQNRLLFESHRNLPSAVMKQSQDFSAPMISPSSSAGAVRGKHNLGVVHVKLTGKTMQDIESSTKTIVLLIFISAWFFSVLAVSFNTYILSKHLRTLVRGVKRLSSGDFGYKISENDLWGELRLLAQSFNDMSLRLRAYEAQNLDTITFERNKLEAVLLSIADGVIVCDTQGQVVIMNDSACRMLGVKNHRVLMGTPIRDYVTVEGTRCFAPLIQQFEEAFELHSPVTSATVGHLFGRGDKRPESFSRPVEMPGLGLKVIISSILDLEGQKLGFVMIMHDVTKEMEVDKLKTNFISNVSHELRTPVTTIKSYVDTLCNHGDDLDPETYQEFMHTVNLETDRLKKLVNDILDFSRLEEGGVKLEMEALDIGPIINLTVQSLKVLAQQKNLSLSTAVESNLPPLILNSDSIERVLRNLISNAIKYTEPGGRIKVRAEMTQGSFPQHDADALPAGQVTEPIWGPLVDCVEISVQDTGIGIPEEHLPFIFDRFYRVENKVHTVRGTGLGLHLVKVAIENHHDGVVFVKSDPGTGSTFGFRLPVLPVVSPIG